ncbi:D-alanyl-D-alanine carboxypeptidase [Agromyces sp. 3263]|uniref:serine hydrolase domain-containing protein n=1 Tax=Agromyces sp. 3263 TaxID=2817750 RepID=UPI0028583862|nr:serine hydrolase domain-containing protein [Agromyces sp. 3263]MDR6905903.1 D-alanyl-D-alanine carboxypeptidase [Agromyces sp. 3263]
MGERQGPSRRRRGFPAVATAVVLAFGLSGCFGASVSPVAKFDPVDAPFADDLAERLDAVLDQAVALSGSSGGIAGVWAPWAGEWTGASGTVGFGEKAPAARVDDSFRLATLTTEVTCTVLLRLVDAGTVQLDDEVKQYVDWIPSLDGITLEQLCRDTSGLADYYPVLRSTFISNPERIWPPNELLSNGLALTRVGPPGEQVRESRTGILLLAFALERASGRSWADLAAQYVYDPLDLEQTRMPQASVTEHAGVLGAYSAAITPTGAPDCAVLVDDSTQSSSMGGAAAGAISTLEDTRTLSEAFATGALLSEKAEKQQWTTIPLGGNAPAWQSAGIGGLQYGPMRGTAGEVPGALTAAFTDPDNGLTVVVALNNSTPGPDFVRETAFALASIASKADAAEGRKRPLTELPWSVDQATANMQALGICPKA